MEETMEIEITKTGLPCLWERGGATSNMGSSRLICDSYGKPINAVYVRKHGHLANLNHALLPVSVSDCVIKVFQHRGHLEGQIYEITSIDKDEKKASLKLISEFDKCEEVPMRFLVVSMLASKKAFCYHCRTPYYINNEGKYDGK